MEGIGLLLAVLIAGFGLSLILPVLWLIISKIIRPLRRRPGISYGIAMALAFVWGLLEIRGDRRAAIVGAPFAAAFLFWQYKRAKAMSLQPEPFVRLPPASVAEAPMRRGEEPQATVRSQPTRVTTARMPLASRVAWVVASLYGVRLVLIGAVNGGSGEVEATVGVLMIGLALAVKRGERSATWLLDVLWMGPVVLFLRAEDPLEAAIPLVLASTSVWAGFALRRRVPSVTTAEQWIRVLPVFAFLQAGRELFLVARSVVLDGQLARPHLIEGVVLGA